MPLSSEEKLYKLETILKTMDDNISREDFVNSFEQVVKLIKTIERKNEDTITRLEESYQEVQNQLRIHSEMMSDEMRTLCEEELTSMVGQLGSKMSEVDSKLAQVKDGKDSDPKAVIEAVIAQIPPVKEVVLDGPEELADKLDTLEGEARLKSIIELEKKIEALEERIKTVGATRIVAGPNANAVQYADLSSQLDGSKKIFVVPRHRQILGLFSTQFPNFFRPTTDFTTSNLQLTINSSLGPIASDQTLIFLYVK